MIYPPGISIKTISDPITFEAIELLSKSIFSTFETSYVIFKTPDADALKTELMRMIRSTGRKSESYHAPYGTEWDLSSPDEEIRKGAAALFKGLFPEAKQLGAELLVIHGSYEPILENERKTRVSQLRKSLIELDAELKRNSFRIAVELLPRSCIGNTAEELLEVIAGFDDTFGVCLDVNHMMGRGKELAQTVITLGQKLYSLHISDYGGIDECHWLPGKGIIDWEAFFNALQTVNYKGIFNYELRLTERSVKERIAAVEKNYTDFILPLMKK